MNFASESKINEAKRRRRVVLLFIGAAFVLMAAGCFLLVYFSTRAFLQLYITALTILSTSAVAYVIYQATMVYRPLVKYEKFLAKCLAHDLTENTYVFKGVSDTRTMDGVVCLTYAFAVSDEKREAVLYLSAGEKCPFEADRQYIIRTYGSYIVNVEVSGGGK